ncbi:hypothetical protein Naga_102544g1 [Nannochloropsis gaditana]|uniref:Uncharacterized protein n=1 Tax=Nannochloropsis gaditana TaxID=72520 RepID=W7T919_9STRA|nr:hypothetical protein Naga_102544g1 [Nannochloropsis gaditana]
MIMSPWRTESEVFCAPHVLMLARRLGGEAGMGRGLATSRSSRGPRGAFLEFSLEQSLRIRGRRGGGETPPLSLPPRPLAWRARLQRVSGTLVDRALDYLALPDKGLECTNASRF